MLVGINVHRQCFDAVFRIKRTFAENLVKKMKFFNDQIHIILTLRNLEIREHSSFFTF